MNQEIAEFFVKFTTEGLSEVKGAIDDLGKKMDDVGKATKSATDKSDSFFANIGKGGKWLVALTGFTSTVYALKKAWDSVANAASSTMTIYNQAMLAGTDPKTLERWQNVARHKGLNASEIFSDFRNGRDFLTRFGDVEISDEFNKTFARAGLNSDAVIASLEQGNMDALFRMLNTALSARDEFGNALVNETRAKDVLSQIGFGDTMLSLLRLQTLPELLENARLIYTENPDLLRASVERTEARETLRDSWNAIWASPEFVDTQTRILNALNGLMPHIEKIANWCAKKTETVVETVEGVFNETPEELAKTEGGKKKLINSGALAGAGLGLAGAKIGAATGVWFGGPIGSALGALIGAIGGAMIADKNFGDSSIIEKATENGWMVPMGLPQSESNATAIVNLNDVEVTRKTGNGRTEINMSLNEIPTVAR